ncbi:hypothetical protein ABPG74_009454 [Tetrahymena malaccensis]
MKSRVNFNITEKERQKKEEEEIRKRQLAYDQQINEKRIQLRKEFETYKQTDISSNSNLDLDPKIQIQDNDFKKELDKLKTINEQKKISLEKLLLLERDNNALNRSTSMESTYYKLASNSQFHNNLNSQNMQATNGFFATRNSLMSRQEQQSQMDERNIKKSFNFSKNGFSKSYYRSKSTQFMPVKSVYDQSTIKNHIEDIGQLINESEQNIFNENERQEQIITMKNNLLHSIEDYRRKVNQLKRMNDLADQKYKDIFQIELQANDNKRVVNQNVEQAKEKISNVGKLYKQYKDKKVGISQQLKVENEQEEYFLSNVQIKIEESKSQIIQLEKEIAQLDLEKQKYEKREKESYFVGLYLWSFEEIENEFNINRIFLKGQTDNIIQNYYEIEQNSIETPTQVTHNKNHENGTLNEGSVNCVSTVFGTHINIQSPSGNLQNQNSSKKDLTDFNKHNTLGQSKLIKSAQNSSVMSPLVSTPIRINKKSKKKQLKILENVTANYLDDYEVEPPNFDRKEVLEKIHQYYFDHNENIEPVLEQIMEFYKQLSLKSLLQKNQCEEFIQQKKLLTLELQELEQEIKSIKEQNFFVENQSLNQENQETQQKYPDMKIFFEGQANYLDQTESKPQIQTKQEIVDEFLNQKIAMDSGFISKIDNKTNKEITSTINVEIFSEYNKETLQLEKENENLQKFIFKSYLNLVEYVERICLIVPLIDFKIDQLQQKTNIYFEFEYVTTQLLKNSSDLFALVTNGKSLEKEFQKINEQVMGFHAYQISGYSFQKSHSSFHSNFNQGQSLQLQHSASNIKDTPQTNIATNNQKQTYLNIPNLQNSISQFSYQNSQNQSVNQGKESTKTSQQFFKRGSQRQLSYLNFDDNLGINISSSQRVVEDDQTTLPPPISLFTDKIKEQSTCQQNNNTLQKQSTQDKEREQNINQICQEILQDKMARYMLHEQFIKQFISKTLEIFPETPNSDILQQIKEEALKILIEKMNQIFINFQSLYLLIDGYINFIIQQLKERNIEIRTNIQGSDNPPTSGGILSLPKSDFIVKSYMNAYDKQLKYRRNEEEDALQRFARISSQIDKSKLLINSPPSSQNNLGNNIQEQANKKQAIYKFINEISDLRKNMARKIVSPLSGQSFQSIFNNINQPNQNLNGGNNNSMINLGSQQQSQNSNTNGGNQKDQNTFNAFQSTNSISDANQPNQQQNQISNRPGSNNLKFTEEDFIDEERENLKMIERKEYDEYLNKDNVEREKRLQEEKKKKIVYHRLIQNAETDSSKQEKSAYRQFAQDQDVLFKINKLDNNSKQNDFAEKFSEVIKKENNKISSKIAKEFQKFELQNIKTNAIYNIRREINLKERKELQKQDLQNKYFLPQQSSTTKNNQEQKQSKYYFNINQAKQNQSANALFKRRNQSQQGFRNEISSHTLVEESHNVNSHSFSANPTTRNYSTTDKILNKQLQIALQKQKAKENSQEAVQKLRNTLYTPKINNLNKNVSSTSTDDMSNFISINNLQNNLQANLGGNFQNNSSLLVSNYPNSANYSNNYPVHYKYLQQDWIQSFTPNNFLNNTQNINSLSNIYLSKNSNIIRKAFTSQSGQRKKPSKQLDNQ